MGWIVRDERGREFVVGSVPVSMQLGPVQTGTLTEPGTLRFSHGTGQPMLIGAVNVVWKEYFGNHPVVRRAYGVELQAGMRIEAAFTAEIP